MDMYCLKCKRHTKSGNEKISETKNKKYIITAKCVECGRVKSKFISKQKADGIIRNIASTMGKKLPDNPLSKIPIVGAITDLIY